MRDRRRTRRARRPGLLAALVAIVVVGAGGAAWAMTRTSGPSYRLATVGYADVDESINAVGTVSAVNQAAVSFPVSGQVASVPVSLGQEVRAGQVLATLSTVALEQQLAQANQALATDRQRLVQDQSGQSSSSAGGAGTGVTVDSASERPLTAPRTPAAPPGTGAPSPGGSTSPQGATGPAAAIAAVRRAQARLVADQQALDAVLTDATLKDLLALTAPSGPCAATPSTTQVTATTDATGTITVTTPQQADITAGAAAVGAPVRSAAGYSYPITGTPGTGYQLTITVRTVDPATCTAAVQQLVTGLDPSPSGSAWSLDQAVNRDELLLQAAITSLERLAGKAGSGSSAGGTATRTGGAAPRTAGTATRTGGTATGTVGTATGNGGGGAPTQPVTPEQIAADQAAVDSAAAQVAVARQNLGEARITSPIAGRVEDIGLTVGATAGSNTITVVGDGAHEVSTTVPLSEIDKVKVGDRATVDVDGVSSPLSGKVSGIGVLSSTAGSTTAYPVTVLLDPSPSPLFNGAGAAVSIAVASAGHVLTVPSSAVHALGGLATVTVLAGGKTQVTRVGVGAVGDDRTQITSGLTLGQQVVLAQLDAPLPSSTNPLSGLRGSGLGGRGVRLGTGSGG